MRLNADEPKSVALCLYQFLKMNAIADTGGHAKVMIQAGEVKLNGQIETRRRKKLSMGDVVELNGRKWVVQDDVP